MNEKYPVHIMIKPEGRAQFLDFIRSKIDLLTLEDDIDVNAHFVTILTEEQVLMIYPEEKIPVAFKQRITETPTEHYIMHGSERIYGLANEMKGKVIPSSGIRGILVEASKKLDIPLERWTNFVHSSESIEEAYPICSHFIKDIATCSGCVARSLCYGARGSSMPDTSLRP